MSDGSFDVIFNICRASDDPINRFGVPRGFEQVHLGPEDVASLPEFHDPGSHVSNATIQNAIDPPHCYGNVTFHITCMLMRETANAGLVTLRGRTQRKLEREGLGEPHGAREATRNNVLGGLDRLATIDKRRLGVDAGAESNVFLPLGAGAVVEISTSSKKAAVLLLPDGASRANLRPVKKFRNYAIKHARHWYEFVNGNLERMVENGDLYLVTGMDKTSSWSIAAAENQSENSQISLKLKAAQVGAAQASYIWEWEAASSFAASGPRRPPAEESWGQNQTIFLRGYKVAIRSTPLKKSAKALSIVDSKPSDILSKSGFIPFSESPSGSSSFFRGASTSGQESASDDVGSLPSSDSCSASDSSGASDKELVEYFPQSTKLYHPGYAINEYLLSSTADAMVAVTHDNDWMSLLNEDDEEIPEDYGLIRRISHTYTIENIADGVWLEHIDSGANGGKDGDSKTVQVVYPQAAYHDSSNLSPAVPADTETRVVYTSANLMPASSPPYLHSSPAASRSSQDITAPSYNSRVVFAVQPPPATTLSVQHLPALPPSPNLSPAALWTLISLALLPSHPVNRDASSVYGDIAVTSLPRLNDASSLSLTSSDNSDALYKFDTLSSPTFGAIAQPPSGRSIGPLDEVDEDDIRGADETPRQSLAGTTASNRTASRDPRTPAAYYSPPHSDAASHHTFSTSSTSSSSPSRYGSRSRASSSATYTSIDTDGYAGLAGVTFSPHAPPPRSGRGRRVRLDRLRTLRQRPHRVIEGAQFEAAFERQMYRDAEAASLAGTRRPSLPMAIPGVAPDMDVHGNRRKREGSLATLRRPSRSLDDQVSVLTLGEREGSGGAHGPTPVTMSVPESDGDWRSLSARRASAQLRESPTSMTAPVFTMPIFVPPGSAPAHIANINTHASTSGGGGSASFDGFKFDPDWSAISSWITGLDMSDVAVHSDSSAFASANLSSWGYRVSRDRRPSQLSPTPRRPSSLMYDPDTFTCGTEVLDVSEGSCGWERAYGCGEGRGRKCGCGERDGGGAGACEEYYEREGGGSARGRRGGQSSAATKAATASHHRPLPRAIQARPHAATRRRIHETSTKHSKVMAFSIHRHYKPTRPPPSDPQSAFNASASASAHLPGTSSGANGARGSVSGRGGYPSAMEERRRPTAMILLAPRYVQEAYTSTNRLRSHGLLDEGRDRERERGDGRDTRSAQDSRDTKSTHSEKGGSTHTYAPPTSAALDSRDLGFSKPILTARLASSSRRRRDSMDDSDSDTERVSSRTTHNEMFSTMDARRAVRRGLERCAVARAAACACTPNGKALRRPHQMYIPPWVTLQSRVKQEERRRRPDVLNNSFGDVGLLPPKKSTGGRRMRGAPIKGVDIFAQVPPDALFMLLPLWPGPTDPVSERTATKEPHEIPTEQRRYLLVSYKPTDERAPPRTNDSEEGRESKKGSSHSSPTGSADGATGKGCDILLTSYHIGARLVSHADLQGSGVCVPDEGLAVLGPWHEAWLTMPQIAARDHGLVNIGTCVSRDAGIEFDPEGLVKMGLCIPVPLEAGAEDLEEPIAELTPIGKAVLEMMWIGCIAVTSFGPAGVVLRRDLLKFCGRGWRWIES
ncbi:hypothetical protein B0H14DRAFT_3170564 [Mycena olivaceomarginata]|nr:hypothetical protein B0H14DRAFT_3170564 [Mycena olivaceomarginata]